MLSLGAKYLPEICEYYFMGIAIRFYDRQFINRDNANKDIFERFEDLRSDFFTSDKPQKTGLPTVAIG